MAGCMDVVIQLLVMGLIKQIGSAHQMFSVGFKSLLL